MVEGTIPDLGLGIEDLIYEELTPWQKIYMAIQKRPRIEKF